MKYTKKELGSYNLHMIKTDKFKTVTVRVMFRRKISRLEITNRVILSSVLLQSSKKYDSKRMLNIKSQDLYSSNVAIYNTRIGDYLNTVFNLSVLNDKYTEEGNLDASLEFLSEIMFNPDVEKGKFKSSKLDMAISKTRTRISSIKEDASEYSLIRCLEAYDKNSSISIRMSGYAEDLDKITEENLYKCYLDMLNNDLVDIFVIGDFNEEEMFELVRKYFKFRILKKNEEICIAEGKGAKKKRLFAKETISNTQSKLNIVCTFKGLSKYELNYVLPLYNALFGGGTESKLFMDIREKNSLCYSIGSHPYKLDHILLIQTGIDRKNYEKTLELIEKNLLEMKKGQFLDNDIVQAKKYFETSYDEVEEDPNSVLDLYMGIDLLGYDELEKRREIIKNVTKNEIIKVAKKIKMDTVFLLEGVKNDN